MKKSAIGITVAVIMLLAGSIASAESSRGRSDDRSSWQQNRQSSHSSHGRDWRDDDRDRRDGRWGRHNGPSNGGFPHGGHVHPTPPPRPAPPAVIVPRHAGPRYPGNHRRVGRRPIMPAQLAAIRAELRLHSRRIADLNLIRTMAMRTGNRTAVALVNRLIMRENIRHQTQMASLWSASSFRGYRS